MPENAVKGAVDIILNGKSAGKADVRAAVAQVRASGKSVTVHVTWEVGDAKRMAAALARYDEHVVVAAGGDGTVNEVLGGLFVDGPPRARMGIMPLGTANDFATSAGIPINNLTAALQLAVSGLPSNVDVGRMNGQCFLNVASGGFGAEVTSHTPVAMKNALGGAAYTLEAMVMAMKPNARDGRLVTPTQTFEGPLVMFAVGNGRQAGGGAHMTPAARVNDGMLDVMLVPDYEHARTAHLLQNLVRLKVGDTAGFQYTRCDKLLIESASQFQVNLDGEPMFGKSFAFDVLPSALSLVLGPRCALLVEAGA